MSAMGILLRHRMPIAAAANASWNILHLHWLHQHKSALPAVSIVEAVRSEGADLKYARIDAVEGPAR